VTVQHSNSSSLCDSPAFGSEAEETSATVAASADGFVRSYLFAHFLHPDSQNSALNSAIVPQHSNSTPPTISVLNSSVSMTLEFSLPHSTNAPGPA
jgi:microsomal dipeptidase-like Zn-dependent dipeptidase